MGANMQRLRAVVHGRVQGVNFRYFTQRRALELGVTGWVRNLGDGRSVEVVAEGLRMELEDLLVFLRQGPPAAHVLMVDVYWEHATGEFDGFDVVGWG